MLFRWAESLIESPGRSPCLPYIYYRGKCYTRITTPLKVCFCFVLFCFQEKVEIESSYAVSSFYSKRKCVEAMLSLCTRFDEYQALDWASHLSSWSHSKMPLTTCEWWGIRMVQFYFTYIKLHPSRWGKKKKTLDTAETTQPYSL